MQARVVLELVSCRLLDLTSCSCLSTCTEGRSLVQPEWSRYRRDPIPSCTIAVRGDSEGEGKQVVSLWNDLDSKSLPAVHVHSCCSCGRFKLGAREPLATNRDESYLVDPASSHMLVSKIKPCMSKYKLLYGETANGSLNQLSSIWLCPYYMDNRSNSRANTCEKSRLLEGMYLLD